MSVDGWKGKKEVPGKVYSGEDTSKIKKGPFYLVREKPREYQNVKPDFVNKRRR